MLSSSRGFTLILGEAGTGKTTLVRGALAGIDITRTKCVLLNNPTLGRDEFYDCLAREFGLCDAAHSSKAVFLREFQSLLEARHAAGELTSLIVDEAQSMPYELLEEIRLLGNIETPTAKLLNIVLSGQPAAGGSAQRPLLTAAEATRCPAMRAVAVTLGETASYISGCLRIAGGSPVEIFTRQAVEAILRGVEGCSTHDQRCVRQRPHLRLRVPGQARRRRSDRRGLPGFRSPCGCAGFPAPAGRPPSSRRRLVLPGPLLRRTVLRWGGGSPFSHDLARDDDVVAGRARWRSQGTADRLGGRWYRLITGGLSIRRIALVFVEHALIVLAVIVATVLRLGTLGDTDLVWAWTLRGVLVAIVLQSNT